LKPLGLERCVEIADHQRQMFSLGCAIFFHGDPKEPSLALREANEGS